MSIEVKVPAMGESISSGILAAWHVKDGDTVEKGQHLYDLETDKITSEGTAEGAGVISLKVDEGDEVEVGAIVAEIDESGPGSKKEAKDGDGTSGSDKKKEEGKADEEKEEDEEGDEEGEKSGKGEQPLSPAVRRLAEESGVDPADVKGTGKGGRVTKGDMLNAIEAKEDAKENDGGKKSGESGASVTPVDGEKAVVSGGPGAPGGSDSERRTRRKMTPLRRTIAQRLVQAQQNTAMLTTFNEVDMAPVMALRKKHQDAFVKKHGVKLGFMSFFTKAVVQALKAVPGINAQIDGDYIVENHFYDIGIAVSTPKGLLVPVVRDCDSKGFAEIEKSILEYADKAKQGKIGIDDIQGGVFTITNGGIFGSMLSTPILNQPQSAILGMHTIKERPVAVNGEIVIRPMMYLALSYDHRVVDGREAVTFLVRVKELLEDPATMLFEL
ncbi:MAG: 2-oxoglutarate dehydrogenase complex dihydrolipoyllysine-residue succinyltransferase [Opitutales bacterium]|nr:2-oxoglutarate dehydrogenase complex dihydrolipoyllysine-residue succinyltransferase [Opitutales bacterium]